LPEREETIMTGPFTCRALAGAAAAMLLLSAPAAAQEYPNRELRAYTGVPGGTSVDLTLRYFGNKVQAMTGQQWIVENRPGAGGGIAAKAGALGKPDGYTMFLGTTASQSANRYLYKNLGYDPVKDFTPVARLFKLAFMVAVNQKKTPVNSVAELTAYLKAKKTPTSYGWATASMLASGELYKSLTGVEATPVAYRGGPQQMAELEAGELDFVFGDAAYAINPTPNLRVLAVTLDRRSTVLPELPTMIEAGLPGFQQLSAWFAIYMPSGTPQPVVHKMNAMLNQALALPETAAFLKQFAGEPFPGTPEELLEFQEAEAKRWEGLVKLAKIEPQ
jgi:tripartite-type tricarboxylate transporter receptor subunit TctC